LTDRPIVLSMRGTWRRRGSREDGFTIEIPEFEVRRGDCIALTGPSGCGKSTLLDLLGLVLRPDGSDRFRIEPEGEPAIDVAALWREDGRDALSAARAVHVGYVLQTSGLLPFLSARDNLLLSRSLLGLEDDDFVARLVESLGLSALRNRKPSALSIGERQRVAIARALAHRPTLLLADEPTAALDPHQALRTLELLLELVRETSMTAILVTHDWEMVSSLGLREVRGEPFASARGSGTRFSCA
jgi:putative ABC transport system ATP-binding protein